MTESIKVQDEAGSLEMPKKLGRTAKKLADKGEYPVLIAPALLRSQATEQMLTIARMGMLDKVLGYLVTTKKSVHFVRPALAWDRVQSIPLDAIDGVEYVDEFHNNTLKLKVGEKAESIIFYDEMDGIRFYRYIKDRTRK